MLMIPGLKNLGRSCPVLDVGCLVILSCFVCLYLAFGWHESRVMGDVKRPKVGWHRASM